MVTSTHLVAGNLIKTLVAQSNTHTGVRPKPKKDDFSDLLGSGFNPRKNTDPRTLKDMKAKNAIGQALDPDSAKVYMLYMHVAIAMRRPFN